jgi:lysophospholipase L1-like esterase
LALAAACTTGETRPGLPPVQALEPPEREPERELPPVATPPAPVDVPAARGAHAKVQQTLHGGALPADPLVGFAAIDDRTLSRFHGALQRLERGEDVDGKVRIAWYGSSSVAADRYTGYVRGYLQERFGDGGIGYVAVVPLWRWHRHNEVVAEASKGWAIMHAQKSSFVAGDRLGLLGASATASRKKMWATLDGSRGALTSARASSRLELHYLQQPGGGRFSIERGGKTLATVSTRASTPALGRFDVEGGGKQLPLRLTAQGGGDVRLLGAVLERDDRGVVLDALGVGGTRAADLLRWDAALWREAIALRMPDLVVLAYGANEATDDDEPIETYRDNLGAVLERIAEAAPQADCLLVGPVDFPIEDETGAWVPRPRVDSIVEIQREQAAAHGCGFFDTREMMGGVGAMDRWVAGGLAKDDHLHLTKLGYLQLGRVLVDAMMRGLDRAAEEPRTAAALAPP